MEDKHYLHTSNYPARRRRRGCFGFVIFVLLVLIVAGVLSRITFSGVSMIPVFGNSVGVVRIEGPINESRDVVKIIRSFRENPLIKAIVLRLDTPGGSVGASEEIYREVVRARDKDGKRVIASMGNAAASGGYYIASAAEEIFANAGTMTGSIGVIAMDWNVEGVLRKVGVQSVVLKSGEHKDTGSPLRELNEEDRALLQGIVYDMYRQFLRTVLRERHKQIQKVLDTNPQEIADVLSTGTTKRADKSLEWDAFTTGAIAAEVGATTESEIALRWAADGRVLSGEQAMRIGLVDHLGTLQDAVERAGEIAGLGKKPMTVERKPESALPSLLGASARRFWSEFSRNEPSIQYRGND